jgi:preprotein translocase subunit SecG
VISTILTIIYIVSCVVLILFVLLQPGKSDASAMFGGGANSAAFGPRGTQTVLAKVTITEAIVFFLIAFLFNIPGLFDATSIGERGGAADQQTTQPAPQPVPVTPEAPPAGQPAAPAQPAPSGEAPKPDGQK